MCLQRELSLRGEEKVGNNDKAVCNSCLGQCKDVFWGSQVLGYDMGFFFYLSLVRKYLEVLVEGEWRVT